MDIEITKDATGELMVFRASGLTDEGTDFIDSYMPAGAEIAVVDSGRIILPEADLTSFISLGRQHGLQVAEPE